MDDDNYVNPRALLKLLKAFPQALDAYIGRPSLNRPIHASEPQPHNRTVCSSLTPSYTGHHSLGQARFGVRARPGQTQPGEGARLGQGCLWRSREGFLGFRSGLVSVCLGWWICL